LLSFVVILALGPTVFLVDQFFVSGTGVAAHGRLLAFTAVADVVWAVGAVLAVRSIRARDPRQSWRLLGWTGLASVVVISLLTFNANTKPRRVPEPDASVADQASIHKGYTEVLVAGGSVCCAALSFVEGNHS
jgi:hypothetical protein